MGNKRKVTLITNADFPYGMSGENFTRNIALGLAENDTQIQVIRYRGRMFTHENDTSIECKNYLYKQHPKNGIAKGLQIILNSLYTPFFVFHRKLFKHDKVFVIFALKYAYELLPFLFWSKIFNIKVYQVIADHYSSKNIVPVWWKKPKYYAYAFQRKYLDRFFNGLVVLSKFLKEEAIRNKVPQKKVFLLPHFIVFEKLPEQNVKKQNKIICYCGTLSIDNGILELVKAHELLRKVDSSIELRLVGGHNEELIEAIDQSDIDSSKIHFTGFVDKDKVLEEMISSSVLVNPRRESQWAEAGFPTKIGEYFATKKPVVTSAVGDLTAYFTDKKEVVFATPNDQKSLAESIQFIFNNEDLASNIGRNGYEWANEHLDYRRNGQKMIEFIEKT